MRKTILVLMCFLTSCAVEQEITGYYKSIYTPIMVKETILIPVQHIPYNERYRGKQNYKPFSNPMFIERDKYYDDIHRYGDRGYYNSLYRNNNVIMPQQRNTTVISVKKLILDLDRFKTGDGK